MLEPTYKQHKILEIVKSEYKKPLNDSDKDIREYWELVRSGYLKGLVSFKSDWVFILTEKGEHYLEKSTGE